MGDELANLIIARALEVFALISAEEAAQTYVVSFFVNDDEDNPSLPVLRIGTNTEPQVRSSFERASDSAEARWNFAFWRQNELAIVGGPSDPEGRAVVDSMFSELGLRYDDADYSPEAEAIWNKMTSAFVSCCIDAARRLHGLKAFQDAFGRDIPVLVHELEYYDAIAKQNAFCNPTDLVAPFKQWIDSM